MGRSTVERCEKDFHEATLPVKAAPGPPARTPRRHSNGAGTGAPGLAAWAMYYGVDSRDAEQLRVEGVREASGMQHSHWHWERQN